MKIRAAQNPVARPLIREPHAKITSDVNPAAIVDGNRALKLAQSLYEATGLLEHGALVGLALSEVGRCSEAADWQRKLIDIATKEQREDLLPKLKTDLQRYEHAPCRPVAEL